MLENGAATKSIGWNLLSMTRPPLSVIVISVVFIAAGTIGLLFHATEFRSDHPFESELLVVLALRLAAVIGGAFLLWGKNWARWLLIAWLAWHVYLGALHTREAFVIHALLLAVFAWLLCREPAAAYFRGRGPSTDA